MEAKKDNEEADHWCDELMRRAITCSVRGGRGAKCNQVQSSAIKCNHLLGERRTRSQARMPTAAAK